MSIAKPLTQEELDRFKEEIEKGRCVLLDVRERGEYEAGHLPSALFRPLSQIDSWPKDMDKEGTVVIYCRTQNRSKRCAEHLSNLGFKDVYYLEGGYLAWSIRPKPL